MKRTQGLAAVLAVALLAGGGAVAAASSSGSGTGTTTTGTTTTGTTTTTTTGTTTTTPAPTHRQHGARGPRGFGSGFGGFGGGIAGGGLGFFDPATTTALQETFKAVETARTTATDAGKAPDDIRDAAIAAAKTRLDQAVTDGALTKAQGAAVLAALTKEATAAAAVVDAEATVLKLTPTELAKRLASGDRLDEIAKAQGVDVKDVFAAIMKLRSSQGGASGTLGPMGGFGGRGGFGMGHGGFGHRGPGGTWPGAKPGQAPAPPTQTQPSTQGGSYAPKSSTATI